MGESEASQMDEMDAARSHCRYAGVDLYGTVSIGLQLAMMKAQAPAIAQWRLPHCKIKIV